MFVILYKFDIILSGGTNEKEDFVNLYGVWDGAHNFYKVYLRRTKKVG